VSIRETTLVSYAFAKLKQSPFRCIGETGWSGVMLTIMFLLLRSKLISFVMAWFEFAREEFSFALFQLKGI
jgi:hypothetical protein